MFSSRSPLALALAAATMPALQSCEQSNSSSAASRLGTTIEKDTGPLITRIDNDTFLIKPDPDATQYSTPEETALALSKFRKDHPGEWIIVSNNTSHPLISVHYLAIRATAQTTDGEHSTIQFFGGQRNQ